MATFPLSLQLLPPRPTKMDPFYQDTLPIPKQTFPSHSQPPTTPSSAITPQLTLPIPPVTFPTNSLHLPGHHFLQLTQSILSPQLFFISSLPPPSSMTSFQLFFISSLPPPSFPSRNPCLPLNCSSLPFTLLPSQLNLHPLPSQHHPAQVSLTPLLALVSCIPKQLLDISPSDIKKHHQCPTAAKTVTKSTGL